MSANREVAGAGNEAASVSGEEATAAGATDGPPFGPDSPPPGPNNPAPGPSNPASGPNNPTSGPNNPASGPTRSRIATLMDRGVVLAIVAFGVYAALASPYVIDNDNAELATLGAVGGGAHPSGYPLYVMWLRAWSWLPTSPAYAAAFATAILAAVQLGVLHAACRAWGARPLAATIAVAVYAGSPFVLESHTEAEVFALNSLVVASVLWLAAEAGPLHGTQRAFALGAVAGLGLANHLTCALVAPVGLYGVVRAAREATWRRAAPLAIAGLAIGLAPYAYLFVADENPMSFGRPHDLGELVDIALRRQYGAGSLMGGDAPVPIGKQLAALALVLARSWLWILLPVGLAGFALRIARSAGEPRAGSIATSAGEPRVGSIARSVGEPRAGWIALAASFALAGPLLVTRFDVEPEGLGLFIVHRFHILPALLLVVPVAVGLDAAWARLAPRAEPRPAAHAAATLAFIGAVALSLPELATLHTPAMQNGARNTLRSLPPNAVVFTVTDELDVGFRYLQLALGERADVLTVRPRALGVAWYRDRFPALPAAVSPGALADAIMRSGRPLFVMPFEDDILRAFPSYPYGILMRVLPGGETPPPLAEIVATNQRVFESFDLDYATPSKDDTFAALMHRRYASVWKRLGDALARSGNRSAADDAYQNAARLAPRP